MEHRFQWDSERIRYFRDAAENGTYHRTLAALLAQQIQQNDAVLDAGCGLGYLSEALLPYCRSVTAVDCDPAAIEALRGRIHGSDRIQAICADVHSLRTAYDVIVCCYFGSTKEALRLFQTTRSGKLILIRRRRSERRFGERLPDHARTAAKTEQILRSAGYAFNASDTATAFDQPFRSAADAARFFSLYRSEPVSESEAVGLCKKTDDPVFPYRLPVVNEMRMFVIRS